MARWFHPLSVLVDAFADELTTGTLQGFPKHLPRSDGFNYFSDMSVWAGTWALLVLTDRRRRL
jgi:hypothetical protein